MVRIRPLATPCSRRDALALTLALGIVLLAPLLGGCARNPATGEPMEVKESVTVGFKPSTSLRTDVS